MPKIPVARSTQSSPRNIVAKGMKSNRSHNAIDKKKVKEPVVKMAHAASKDKKSFVLKPVQKEQKLYLSK